MTSKRHDDWQTMPTLTKNESNQYLKKDVVDRIHAEKKTRKKKLSTKQEEKKKKIRVEIGGCLFFSSKAFSSRAAHGIYAKASGRSFWTWEIPALWMVGRNRGRSCIYIGFGSVR
jgi:phage pi2 protein 07